MNNIGPHMNPDLPAWKTPGGKRYWLDHWFREPVVDQLTIRQYWFLITSDLSHQQDMGIFNSSSRDINEIRELIVLGADPNWTTTTELDLYFYSYFSRRNRRDELLHSRLLQDSRYTALHLCAMVC